MLENWQKIQLKFSMKVKWHFGTFYTVNDLRNFQIETVTPTETN